MERKKVISVDPFNVKTEKISDSHEIIQSDGLDYLTENSRYGAVNVWTNAIDSHVLTYGIEKTLTKHFPKDTMGVPIVPDSFWQSREYRKAKWEADTYIDALVSAIRKATGHSGLFISTGSEPLEERAQRFFPKTYEISGCIKIFCDIYARG